MKSEKDQNDEQPRKKSEVFPFSFLPDEEERKGKPGCPGGNSPWPNGCFDRKEQPDGCWGSGKKP
jgi:hypothetical protein